MAVPGDVRTFAFVVSVQAGPFSGQVEEIALEDDLRFFASNLARMTAPGQVIFGGDRMAELRFLAEPQEGGEAGKLVIEASVTASGDQWPRLTMLLFDQDEFWTDAAEKLMRIVGTPAG